MNPLLVPIVTLFPQYGQISAYFHALLDVFQEVRTFPLDLLQFGHDCLLLSPELFREFLVVCLADFLVQDVPLLEPRELAVDLLEPLLHDLGLLEPLGVHLDHGRLQFHRDDGNELVLDGELPQLTEEFLAQAVGIDIALALPATAIVVGQRGVAHLAVLLLGDVACEGFAAMLADQKLLEGQAIVFLIDRIAVVVVGLEDAVHCKEDLRGNDRLVLSLQHLAFQEVVCKQSAIQGAFQHPRHGVAGDVKATGLELLANLLRRHAGVLVLPHEGPLDEGSLDLVDVQHLVHPLVADGRVAAPMALPEPRLGAVHAPLAADVVLLLGPDQLLVFHAGAIDLLVVDGHGRRLDGDAVPRPQLLLEDDGCAALAGEPGVVVEDDVADLVGLLAGEGKHLVKVLADAADLRALALVAELGDDLVAVALGELSASPSLDFEAHAVLLRLAGHTGVEDAPPVVVVGLAGLAHRERLEQIKVIHAHASFG